MKSALIIGGNSDIAKALTIKLLKDGYNVSSASRNIKELKIFKSKIGKKFNNKINLIQFDIMSQVSQNNLILSLKPVPKLIIFAIGDLGNEQKLKDNLILLKKNLDVNFTNQAFLIYRIINLLKKKNGKGKILIISSVAGLRGKKSNYIYGAAKSAMNIFAEGLRQEYNPNIKVLLAVLGFVNTKMTKHLKLPKLLTASPVQIADRLFDQIKKSKDEYIPFRWRVIFFILNLLPTFIYKKLRL